MLQKATKRTLRLATPAVTSVNRFLRSARTSTLVVAGFGAIDYGLFQINPIAGWFGIGASCLIIEALTDDPEDGETE